MGINIYEGSSKLDKYLNILLVECPSKGSDLDILQWWTQLGSTLCPIIPSYVAFSNNISFN